MQVHPKTSPIKYAGFALKSVQLRLHHKEYSERYYQELYGIMSTLHEYGFTSERIVRCYVECNSQNDEIFSLSYGSH